MNVDTIGNPWLRFRCEECNTQILSYNNLGLAIFFNEYDDDPWETGISEYILRYVCVKCSFNIGYED